MPPKRKAASIEDEPASAPTPAKKSGVLRFLTCKEGISDKFYEISLTPNFDVVCRYGRTGSQGVSIITACADAAAAMSHVEKMTAEKKKKGYVESAPPGAGAAVAKEETSKPSKGSKASKSEATNEPKPNTAEAKKKPAALESKGKAPAATSNDPAPVYLECIEGSSCKFWEATQNGDKVTVRFGRIGSDGTRSEKTFGGDSTAATKFVEKMTKEKLGKGYKVATATSSSDGGDFTGPTYFVSMCPKDETYHGEDETVEYDVLLRELTLDGAPCSIVQWFEYVWRTSADGEDAAEECIQTLLNVPSMQALHGIWGLWDEDDRPKTFKPLNNETKLKAWLKEHLPVERDIVVGQHGILIGSTSEFDVEYAFFRPQALPAGELGKHLTPLLQVHEATGQITVKQATIRYSAYL